MPFPLRFLFARDVVAMGAALGIAYRTIASWCYTPQNHAGEAIVLSMAYRVTATGSTSSGPFHLYGYSFAINTAKTVASITLPSPRNVVVVALNLHL